MVYPSGARAVCLMFPWKAALKRFELFVVLLDMLVGESMERMLWAENAAEDNPGWCFSYSWAQLSLPCSFLQTWLRSRP